MSSSEKGRVFRIRSNGEMKLVAYILTVFFMLVVLFPLGLIILYSVKDALAIYDYPPKLLPSPARSVDMELDYTRFAGEDSSRLLDRMLRDAAIAMYVTCSDQSRGSLGEIKVYGTLGHRTVFYQRAHTMLLRLQLDYGVYRNVLPLNRATLTAEQRYLRSAEKIGYTFDLAGIQRGGTPGQLDGQTEQDLAIAAVLQGAQNDRLLDGALAGTSIRDRWILLLENYRYYAIVPQYMYPQVPIIARFSFLAFVFNTLLVMVWAAITQVGLCSLTAFALSRLFKRKMSNILMFFFLVTTMIPFMSIVVPQLILIRRLGMVNTYGAMLLPYLYPAAFYTYLFRGFFDRLPQSLFDAASIDGASAWYRYTRICLPLSRPIIAVVTLSVIVSAWGDFFWYFVAANQSRLWTINLALYGIADLPTTKENISMGLSFMAIAPVILLALVFSRQIKESIARSGIRG